MGKGRTRFALTNLLIAIILISGQNSYNKSKSCSSKEYPMIPKLVWQTAETYELPEPIQASMSTWRTLNADWNISLFDDKAAELFMAKNFDERTQAVYSQLPLGVMKVRTLSFHISIFISILFLTCSCPSG